MKPKTQQRAQWTVVLAAVLTVGDQLLEGGTLSPEVAVYVLAATNIISAVLRSAVGKTE